ncbi:YhcH/YjgK/YiaL family protein [Proteiniclasticum sp. BAD-10]|uniref:YhcH/YjgK/YiaL family protein n=1 Tax=Proteiniclasticum sediminis TaxID=2804028 RepID=A0A941CM29_9CLOT|nr:YhcH/YjgK/YiaL family protein [Proteiniclasticum sediminis]MBR0575055.1 YhcH/YjgK/YiaL family protein [Proteiniclasticum sediminis]
MITDNLSQITKYHFDNKNLNEALAFLASHPWNELEKRRYDIKGEEIFLLYQEKVQEPLDTLRYEVHHQYVDIHFTVKGLNLIRSTPRENLVNATVYDEKNDFYLGDYEGEAYTDAYLGEGMFALYFPEDAHLGNATLGEKTSVEKYVMKVKVSG